MKTLVFWKRCLENVCSGNYLQTVAMCFPTFWSPSLKTVCSVCLCTGIEYASQFVCVLFVYVSGMNVCMYACLYLCVWLCSLNLCVWVCVVYLCVCLGTVNTTVYLPLQPCDVSTRTAGLLKPAVAACHLHLHTSTQQSLEASCSTHPSSAACCLANSS